jgi:hypothetical protein
MAMDLAGFAVSAGSACSSGKVRASRVLRRWAMTRRRQARSGSRWGRTTEDDVLRFAEAWLDARRKSARARRRVNGEKGNDDDAMLDHVEARGSRRRGPRDVETVQAMAGKYKYGWETEIEMELCAEGPEPRYRAADQRQERRAGVDAGLAAGRLSPLGQMEEPTWAMVNYPEIDYQDQYYYAKPKSMAVKPKSLDEVDPKLLATYAKLGIPLKEQMLLAGVEGAEERPRARWPWMRCLTVSPGHHLQGGTGQRPG